MKFFHCLGLLLFLFFTYIPVHGSEIPKRYPEVQSAIIKYNVAGMDKGTEMFYFNDWGRRSAKFTDSVRIMGNITEKTNVVNFILDKGKSIIHVDLDKQNGMKMKNPLFGKFNGKSEEEMINFSADMLKSLGGIKSGTEKIAGKTCDLWVLKNAGSKRCIWKGITLKRESVMGNMGRTITAYEIKVGVPIPDDKFSVPANIKIRDITLGYKSSK